MTRRAGWGLDRPSRPRRHGDRYGGPPNVSRTFRSNSSAVICLNFGTNFGGLRRPPASGWRHARWSASDGRARWVVVRAVLICRRSPRDRPCACALPIRPVPAMVPRVADAAPRYTDSVPNGPGYRVDPDRERADLARKESVIASTAYLLRCDPEQRHRHPAQDGADVGDYAGARPASPAAGPAHPEQA